MSLDQDENRLNEEIARLEAELSSLRSKLKAPSNDTPKASAQESEQTRDQDDVNASHRRQGFASHELLLLSDSALPLGSFAFSSGLESYLAHRPARPTPSIQKFLSLSLYSVASTVLPYLLAAYKDPTALISLDDTLDACTLCPVARRASIAQGCALLTLWERSFRTTVDPDRPAAKALAQFAKDLKSAPTSDDEIPNGHFAPVWAVVTAAMGISIEDSAYAFLLNHAKAVMSAGVRASMVGPYQAQGVLASEWLRKEIAACQDENGGLDVADAGQGVPMMDIWIGRHEMLYSRIFNS